MGLLDGVMGGAGGGARQPGIGGTLAAGAILALLVKGVRQYQQSHDGPPVAAGQPQAANASGGLGGLGGLVGGLMGGGGGLGGLLGGLGGAGALGALIDQFHAKGMGAQAGSWVGTGANQPIEPAQVGQVLGESTLSDLEARTGLPRDQLLQELARELPQAIDAATPQGRLPNDDELHEMVSARR